MINLENYPIGTTFCSKSCTEVKLIKKVNRDVYVVRDYLGDYKVDRHGVWLNILIDAEQEDIFNLMQPVNYIPFIDD